MDDFEKLKKINENPAFRKEYEANAWNLRSRERLSERG